MKPIKLKIKGVNSFIEEQEIDFEKLTEYGLFGIFGSTGSGKSTILDGITLALYGDVARKSANFINTNCDKCQVSFEFQISGVTAKRYFVQREFKFHASKNTLSSGKCKLLDITDGQEIIIADSVVKVKEECKSIIGLSLEDFTRTVVLPQGKFSEFLKLEGSSRGNMLERLFNLEQYGDILKGKLACERSKQEDSDNILQGELNAYDGIDHESFEKNKQQLMQIETSIQEEEKALLSINKDYEKFKVTWSYQEELRKLLSEKQGLLEKEEHIKDLESKVVKAEKAEKVVPYMTAFENSFQSKEEIQNKHNNLKRKLDEVDNIKNTCQKGWESIKLQYENRIPDLTIKKEKLGQAFKEKTDLDKVKEEIDQLEIEEKKLTKILEELKENTKVNSYKNKEYEDLISNYETNIAEITLEASFKEKIQNGVILHSQYKSFCESLADSEKKIKNLKITIQNQRDKEYDLIKIAKDNEILQESAKNEKERITNNIPGTQEDLLKELDFKNQITTSWTMYKNCLDNIEAIKNEMKQCEAHLELEKGKITSLTDKLIKLRLNLREIENEGLAHKLREDLKDGEICPVCGSNHHQKENLKLIEIMDTTSIEKEIELKDKELKKIEKAITAIETRLDLYVKNKQTNIDNIEQLGEEFKKSTIEEVTNKYQILNKEITNYNQEKEENEIAVNKAVSDFTKTTGDVTNIQNLLKRNIEILTEEMKQYDTKLEEHNPIKTEYEELKTELGVSDFTAKSKEIKVIEEKIQMLLTNNIKSRNEMKNINTMLETLATENTKMKEKLAGNSATLKEKNIAINDIKKSLLEKADNIETINEDIKSVNIEIVVITNSYKSKQKELDIIVTQYNLLKTDFNTICGNLETIFISHSEHVKSLDKVLKTYDYLSKEEVALDKLDIETINENKGEIQAYKENLSRLQGAIGNYQDKIKNNEITQEKWKEIQELKMNKDNLLKELKNTRTKLKINVDNLLVQLERMEALIKKKKESEHKLSLWKDLEKLLRGKAFVEFVASTRLKYVAIEASRQLKEITNGNYGLEIDEMNNSRFIIRDYKNGGVARDTSTLSGGETFLASLALALALSAEIQLKGTAPLELFFLDEGFGTLDDNLLEVVMDSLEKIHHDKLKVGLISHVESIKNRVPVRLLVTPAEAGKGGSKVKLEIN